MLVTPESDRRNRNVARMIAGAILLALVGIAYFKPLLLLAFPLVPAAYWFVRRKTLRRVAVMQLPFPEQWERVLQTYVEFYLALDKSQQQRFRKLVAIFLAETTLS